MPVIFQFVSDISLPEKKKWVSSETRIRNLFLNGKKKEIWGLDEYSAYFKASAFCIFLLHKSFDIFKWVRYPYTAPIDLPLQWVALIIICSVLSGRTLAALIIAAMWRFKSASVLKGSDSTLASAWTHSTSWMLHLLVHTLNTSKAK